MCERYDPYASSNSAISKVSKSYVDSAWSPGSKKGKALTPTTNMQEGSPISILDRYLYGDVQPFSPYELSHELVSHQLERHDTRLAKLRDQISSTTELFDLLEDPGSSPVLCCADSGFLLGSYATGLVEEVDEINSEVVALEELFNLAVIFAEHQQKFGKLAERTLKQDFELAKAAERNNFPEEAEHRCRRILREYPYIDVQSFLGALLARSFRLEESSSLLFKALAGFIAQFKESSYNMNALMFKSIELLYIEVVDRSELDWTSTSSSLYQMVTRIQNQQTEGNPEQLFPQLLIHGFSFAHECAILGMVDSAKHMYQALLEYVPLHLDSMDYALEMANVYQKYGALLRIEKEWKLSSEQLRLACECAARAGLHDNHLATLLEDDYNHLLPHLTTEPNGEGSLAERVREVLDRIALQVPLHLPDNKAGAQVSCITQYLLSDSPFICLDPLAVSHIPGLELSSRAVGSMQGDGEHTSTWSTIESRNLGETMSEGQVTGISDSYLWPRSAV